MSEPVLTMPVYHHEGQDESFTRLKVLRAKAFARTSTPDESRRAAIARVLIDLDNDPLVWDLMVADHGNPLED